jgi:hypothetical protein
MKQAVTSLPQMDDRKLFNTVILSSCGNGTSGTGTARRVLISSATASHKSGWQYFHYLVPNKKHPDGKWLAIDATVTSWLQTCDTEFILCQYTSLGAMVGQNLKVNGDYAEVWCVSSATLVPCTDRSQNKVTSIIMFVTFLSKSLFYLQTKEFMTRRFKKVTTFCHTLLVFFNQNNHTCTLSECSYVEPWSLSFSYIIPNCRQILLRHFHRWECWLLCDLCTGHSLLLSKKKTEYL